MNVINRQIYLCDTTLRDGAQTPGINLTKSERHSIAEILIESGIDELEAGIPAMGREYTGFLKELTASHSNMPISCWCRCRMEDIREAEQTGAPIIHISVPASPLLLGTLKKNWEEVFETLQNVISAASASFDKVSLGIQDAFRAPHERIRMLAETGAEAGVYRLRIADSVGTALPEHVSAIVSAIDREFSIPIGFHGHNDLGLATANSLAAAEAGAQFIDVTVNGIGERAGNTKLHEAAAVLHLHNSLYTTFDLLKIQEISQLTAKISGRAIPVNEPVIGGDIFTHSSGIHCSSIVENELSYQPFPANFVGRKGYTLLAGTHSGSKGIATMLESVGIEADKEGLKEFLEEIRRKSANEQRSFTAEELSDEYNNFNRDNI